MHPFSSTSKHDVFEEERKGTLGTNGLTKFSVNNVMQYFTVVLS